MSKALTGLDTESTCLLCLLKGIADLLHLGLQVYNSFASRHEAATVGLIPYPIQ